MTNSVVRLVRIRTTDDRAGQAHGVVVGTGTTPQLALAALEQEAQASAEKLVADDEAGKVRHLPDGSVAYPSRDDPGVWNVHPPQQKGQVERQVRRFEVIDVRLTPNKMNGADSGWLAYGTLAWEGDQLQEGTTRSGGSWPGARAPG